MNLVADVGGSYVRFGLVESDGTLREVRVAATTDDFARLVQEYLAAAGVGRIGHFACAAAGPVDADGAIQLTNRSLRLDLPLLVDASRAGRISLLNDFAALAHALPGLGPEDVSPCGGGLKVDDAPALVLGPGTGLGVAAGIPCDGRWQVLPGEGGHADLAPADEDELAVWQALRLRHGRVSAETVLSGPGLQRLHAALGGSGSYSPVELDRLADAGDPLAQQARRLFTRWLGRVAGNLALAFDARGGVFLGGGIVPRWRQHFDHAVFRAGFEDKPPMAARLRAIPSQIIVHPYPALVGLARLAATG